MLAAVNVVIVAPPPAPPVLVLVRISRLALAVVDAVVCIWIASLWVLFASVAAAIVGFLACGSACTGAASTAALVSLWVVILWPCAALLLIMTKFKDTSYYYIDQLEKGAAALGPISEAFVKAHLIAITTFAFLEFLGLLLKLMAIHDPPTSRIASAIMLLPPLGICIMCCLVSIPGLAVRVWRVRRHGQASVVPI